jgi:hypothetical protein
VNEEQEREEEEEGRIAKSSSCRKGAEGKEQCALINTRLEGRQAGSTSTGKGSSGTN